MAKLVEEGTATYPREPRASGKNRRAGCRRTLTAKPRFRPPTPISFSSSSRFDLQTKNFKKNRSFRDLIEQHQQVRPNIVHKGSEMFEISLIGSVGARKQRCNLCGSMGTEAPQEDPMKQEGKKGGGRRRRRIA